jgi:hypothetical protein
MTPSTRTTLPPSPAPSRAKPRRPVSLDPLAGVLRIEAPGNGVLRIDLRTLTTTADIRRLLAQLARHRWANGPILAAIGNLAARELRRGRTTGDTK